MRISHSFEGVSLNAELISFNVFHIQQSGNEITFHRVERSQVLILVYSSYKMRLYIDRMLWSRMLAVAIEGNNKLSIYQEWSGGTHYWHPADLQRYKLSTSSPFLWTRNLFAQLDQISLLQQHTPVLQLNLVPEQKQGLVVQRRKVNLATQVSK